MIHLEGESRLHVSILKLKKEDTSFLNLSCQIQPNYKKNYLMALYSNIIMLFNISITPVAMLSRQLLKPNQKCDCISDGCNSNYALENRLLYSGNITLVIFRKYFANMYLNFKKNIQSISCVSGTI